MAPELLDAVHSRISKKGDGLKDKANIAVQMSKRRIGDKKEVEGKHSIELIQLLKDRLREKGINLSDLLISN